MEDMHHLPRLPRPYYQAFTVVHWTITLEHRAQGWLDVSFHAHFRELMLHAGAREGLFCPTYVLMPDHIHLIWMGLRLASDQINGMRFLRKYLQLELTRRNSSAAPPLELQKQAHDTVLREEERKRGAFASTCFYVLNNPVRAGLVSHPRDWPWLGAVLPGYPDVHPLDDDFWPLFWKLYEQHR
jgi:REP element-mobilizing transposase RayT